MDEYSRPATADDLKTLIASLNRQGAPYLLIGRYALFAHGYHRATTDIDVLVPATQEAGARIRRALMALPDQAAKDIDPVWFDEGENIRVADAFVVDIMLNACGETFETLQQYAETIDMDGLPIRTINLEGLLRTKQTTRDKDIVDRLVWNAPWRPSETNLCQTEAGTGTAITTSVAEHATQPPLALGACARASPSISSRGIDAVCTASGSSLGSTSRMSPSAV